MLHWMRRVAATGVAAALLLSISGCNWVTVAVKILDFNSAQVQGIWLWRADASGSFQRAARYDFSSPQTTSSGEVMEYVVSVPGSSGSVRAEVSVQRSPTNPNEVALVMIYPRSEASGTYRASSFNAAGESALSSMQTTL
jgi:hypothetical protein